MGKRVGRGLTAVVVGLIVAGFGPSPAHALSREAVMDIAVWNGGSTNATSSPCPSGYRWYDTDLNKGARGHWVYLCAKFGPLKDALTGGITNIDIVSLQSSSLPSNPCPSGWTWIKDAFNRTEPGDHTGDLNDGAGGNWIYICYERGSTGPSTIGKGPPIVELRLDTRLGEDYGCTLSFGNDWKPAGDDGPDGPFDATDLNAGVTPAGSLHTYIHMCLKTVEADSEANINWCGNEDEGTCGALTSFVFENGSGPCDRGLRPVGGKCVNGLGGTGRYQDAAGSFQQTWEYWAIQNQRRQLQADLPLGRLMLLGAHNAFNNRADGYFEPNQRYSITDMLRAGVRVIDLDVWDRAGRDTELPGILKLCHSVCSLTDRQYVNAIREIRNWLVRNPDEVVVIVLEDYVRQSRADEVDEPIELFLDRHDIGVFTPADYRANRGFESQRRMLELGKRVVVVAQDLEFADRYVIDKSPDVAYTKTGNNDWSELPCKIGGTQVHPEDPRFAEVNDDRITPGNRLLQTADMRLLARCNVDIVNMDYVLDRDAAVNAEPADRLKAAVWSWTEGDRGDNGDAAMLTGATGRWVSRDPSETHSYACRSSQPDPATGDYRWRVTIRSGPWREAWAACDAEYPGTEFGVPVNAWQNQQLRNQRFGQDIWLNYHDIRDEGHWQISHPPQVFILGNEEVAEGSDAQYSYSPFADGPVTVLAATCGGGTLVSHHPGEEFGGVFTCRFPDGPGLATVGLRVQDDIGIVSVAAKEVLVANVAPTVTERALDRSEIDENGTVTLDGAFTDPGEDEHTVAIDWGDGTRDTITPATGARGFQATHRYLDDDPSGTSADRYEITLAVRDDDGDQGRAGTAVLVRNLAPVTTLDTLTDDSGLEPAVFLTGLSVRAAFSFTDVGTRDRHAATVQWGDGTPRTDLKVSGPAEASHVYANAGSYTVVVEVLDDDTGTGTAAAGIQVVTPAAATELVTADVKALLQGTVTAKARAALTNAIGHLEGTRDGRAANGALTFFAAGDPAAALAALRLAIVELEDAEAADATLDLTAAKALLALAAKSAAVAAINAARERATTAAQQTTLAEATQLLADGDTALAAQHYANAAKAYRDALNRALEV